jgi:hypothetical protein
VLDPILEAVASSPGRDQLKIDAMAGLRPVPSVDIAKKYFSTEHHPRRPAGRGTAAGLLQIVHFGG